MSRLWLTQSSLDEPKRNLTGRTTRSFLEFTRQGEEKSVQTVEDVIETEKAADELLAKVEEISGDIVKSVTQVFKKVTQGGSSS